ncbi:hypothetical protein C2W62_32575 [Candidatus Entotheonella serta]|nr:hypothetical protein C2W62_32575 [Candidatus Entotheonella serta]
MSSELTPSHVLPETAEILSLLRELDIHPRTLPETYDILALLHQLHGSTPTAVQQPPPAVPAEDVEPLSPSPVPSTAEADFSFDVLFDPTPQDEETSVRAFFAAVPWDKTSRTSEAPAPPAAPQDEFPVVIHASAAPDPIPNQELMHLSVHAFFAGVNWDRLSSETRPPHRAATKHSAAIV